MGSEILGESYLIIDIDSSLTKAIFIEKTDGGYSIQGTNEVATTVDPPYLDVTVGVERAVSGLSNRLEKKFWGDIGPSKAHRFFCSSSTSGGLYMMVAGLIQSISAESAQRAALGAGALLMDVYSKNDPRPSFQIVERMRTLRPDMFLLAGGIDGGAEDQVLEMAGLIDAADVKPRFGSEYKLPVVYAGNVEIREKITETLAEDRYVTRAVENVRPLIEVENLGPAREGIYDSYMEHVIIHSPGYDRLVELVDGHIIPTQAAIGKILYEYAMDRRVNMLAADVGGATTDIYSVYNGVFNRSLNADIGMTYGISNIMKEAGIENIMRWIPEDMSEKKIRNIIGNIMALQPETLTTEETMVQQAAAREAIRLGLKQHKNIATRLKGVSLKRTISDMFDQALEASLLDLMKTQVVIGRGQIFTNDITGESGALLLLDALQPEGVTEILVDRSSILPHLGMLLERNRSVALQILSNECLHKLGTCIAARGRAREGDEVMRIHVSTEDSVIVDETVAFGELKAFHISTGESARLKVRPSKRFDVGNGKGKKLEADVVGGEKRLIIDARGRPLDIPEEKEILAAWAESLMRRQAVPTIA